MDKDTYVIRAVCQFCDYARNNEHSLICMREGERHMVLLHGWCKFWKHGHGAEPTEED